MLDAHLGFGFLSAKDELSSVRPICSIQSRVQHPLEAFLYLECSLYSIVYSRSPLGCGSALIVLPSSVGPSALYFPVSTC